jgi:D-alanyl-D-alanine carboxypeptidase/D-alanyl-D-alanine-endopeptidase (penicillin-binding protein 4)
MRNLLFFVIFAAQSAFAAPAPPAPLSQRIAGLVEQYEKSSQGICGVAVTDLRSGETLIEIRREQLFVPASNQKLLTSAFALARLGSDVQFTSEVRLLGNDIVIVGDGDPTLGDPHLSAEAGKSIYSELDRWAKSVKLKVGAKLAGDVLLCSRFALKGYRHPDWDKRQYHRWYAAPVGGLNFHNNCFDVTFTVAGGSATPHVLPESRFIRINSRVKPGRKHLWSLLPNGDDSLLKIRGTVKRSTKDPLSVAANHPPLLLGRTFAERLIRAGVEFTGTIRCVPYGEPDLSKSELLARTNRPLIVALKRANQRSLNMAAECIFLRTGGGTWDRSAKEMASTLVEKYGLRSGDLIVRDGGGLSRKNRVTPRAMSRLLIGLIKRADASIFLSTLPRSALSGTMLRRLVEPPYRGRILAKTGYVAGASNLSGYVLDGENRPAVTFAIMINSVPAGKGHRAKKLQDAICRILVDWLDGK